MSDDADVAEKVSMMRKVLENLCSTIEATGGLVLSDEFGSWVPAGDTQWLDLAEVYCDACKVLGRDEVRYYDDDEDDDDDDDDGGEGGATYCYGDWC